MEYTSATIQPDVNGWWYELKLTTDETPAIPADIDFVYHEVPSDDGRYIIYWAEQQGFVKGFVYKTDERQQTGYGGHVFTILVFKPGGIEAVDIKGPWSGRPSVYMAAGAPAYMECTINSTLVGLTKEVVDGIIEAKHLRRFKTKIGCSHKNGLVRNAEHDCKTSPAVCEESLFILPTWLV